MWTFHFISFAGTKLSYLIHNAKYKALISCPDGKIRYINRNKALQFVVANDGYDFTDFRKHSQEEGWNKDDWNEKYIDHDLPSTLYAPKSVWKRYEKIKKQKDERD